MHCIHCDRETSQSRGMHAIAKQVGDIEIRINSEVFTCRSCGNINLEPEVEEMLESYCELEYRKRTGNVMKKRKKPDRIFSRSVA